MKAPERIETDRLILRRPTISDAEAVFARYAGDAEVTRFIGRPMHRSVQGTRDFLEFADSEWNRSPAGSYLMLTRSSAELLGSTGLAFESPSEASTGYVLAREAWGLGYATEAPQAMLEFVPKLGAQRLFALCHPDHRASWRVLEKCGFKREVDRRPIIIPNLVPTSLWMPSAMSGSLADAAGERRCG